MSFAYKKCFITLRIIAFIISLLFATINITILSISPTQLEYEDILGEQHVDQNLEPQNLELKVLFWLLFAYHCIECLNNVFELVQMTVKHFMPTLNDFFSINACYGIGVFIYSQILLFGEMKTCIVKDFHHKLLYYWVCVEVAVFYISCLLSVVVLLMYYYH